MGQLLNTATPEPGWKDTVIRALKTAVTTGIGVLGLDLAGYTDINAVKAAAIAAASAALTVVLNRVLVWANS